jgi:inner membrane protein
VRAKERRTRDCTRTVIPDELSVTGALATENRYRGIYSARFFVAKLRFEGRFAPQAEVPVPAGVSRQWGTPLLVMGVRDPRGIRSASPLTWNSQTFAFQAGAAPASTGAGLHAPLSERSALATVPQTFSFSAEIMGLQSLNFVPSARQHDVSLTADWAHPSFSGRHLPATREIARDAFRASWRISEFASEAPRMLAACGGPACKEVEQHAFGVNLLDPIDVYVQAHRAVKYALLFVLLTFAGFFLFEIMRDLRIHPVQYGLVGLALAMFFLLLIALSEHLRFIYAYLIAASACVALIAGYLQAVLKSGVRALGFGAMLTALYTMLYALLRSEDHSLLMGAVLVFGVLAAVMLLTRRIDWYSVGRSPAAARS